MDHLIRVGIKADEDSIRSLFIEMLKSVSIVEIARTGTVALTKCKEQ